LGAVLLVVVLAACGGADTAGRHEHVTVSDLQEPTYFYEGDHLGEVVTVSAAVARVRDPHTVELSGDDPGAATMTVLTRQAVSLSQGQAVQVTGRMDRVGESGPDLGAEAGQDQPTAVVPGRTTEATGPS
jgi:hypothetical protein